MEEVGPIIAATLVYGMGVFLLIVLLALFWPLPKRLP